MYAILFLPYLLGIAPVFMARTLPAKFVAIVFGLVALGFDGCLD